MSEIQKAVAYIKAVLDTAMELLNSLDTNSAPELGAELEKLRCDASEAYAFLEALRLLPPEGETCPKHDLLFVDATPDDGYIARILSAYLDDSYYSDNTAGLPPSNPLIVKMNEWREQRNALLRAALAKLAEPAPSSEKALRERCEALAKRWDSESGRESFAPVFAEELLEALASSPAPKTFDEAIAQAGGTGIAEFERKAPAPRAPKC